MPPYLRKIQNSVKIPLHNSLAAYFNAPASSVVEKCSSIIHPSHCISASTVGTHAHTHTGQSAVNLYIFG